MTLPEVEEVTSESFGFRLASSKYGVNLFNSPVDFEGSASGSFPLQLLSVGNSRDIYAASNTKEIVIGKLRDLDEEETAKEKVFTSEFPNVSHVCFNSTNEELYIVASGQIHKAIVNDLLEGKASSFTSVESKGSIIDFQMHYADPASYFYLTSTNDLYIVSSDQESHISDVKSACWNPLTSNIGMIKKGLLNVGSFEASKADQEEWGELIHVSYLDKSNWLVVGSIEDEEDLLYTLITLSDDGVKQAQTIFMSPPMGCADRYHSFYVANTIDWIKDSAVSFITYGQSTDITTVQIDEDTKVLVPSEDTNRAELPMDSETSEDTLPVGFAVDLSGKDLVVKSPCNAIEEAKGVLPRILCLNDQGHLLMWHVFLSDAVNDGSASLQSALDKAIHKPFELKIDSILKSTDQASSELKQESNIKDTNSQKELESTIQDANSQEKVESKIKDAKSQESGNPFNSAASGTSGFGKAGFGSTTLADTIQAFNASPQGNDNTNKNPAFGTSSFGTSSFGTSSSFGKSSFGQTSFGKTSFGGSDFGKTGFGSNSSGGPKPFGQPTPASLGSVFGGNSKFGSTNNVSPFGAMSGSKNIFGGAEESPFAALNKKSSIFDSNDAQKDISASTKVSPFASIDKKASIFESNADKKDLPAPAEQSPFAALNKKASIFETDANKKELPESINATSAASNPFNIFKGDTAISGHNDSPDATDDVLEKNFNGSSDFEKSDDTNDHSNDDIGEFSEEERDLEDEQSSEGEVNAEDSNWVDVNSLENSDDTDSLLSMLKKDLLDDESPKTSSKDYVAPKMINESQQSIEAFDLGKDQSSNLNLTGKLDVLHETIRSDTLSYKEVSNDESSKSKESGETIVEDDKSNAFGRNSSKADDESARVLTLEPTPKSAPKPKPEPRKTLNEILSETEFVQFAGFTNVPSSGNTIADKMKELVQVAQAQLDIFKLNEDMLNKLFSAYSETNLDSALAADSEEENKNNEVELNGDQNENKMKNQDITLANIKDLADEILMHREQMRKKLEHFEEINRKVQEAVEGYSHLDLQRLETQKLVELVQRFSDYINSSKVLDRPMSLNAQRRQLSIRKNLARVKQLHGEVLQKLVPFGLTLDLGETPAARVEKFESVVHQIMAKSRIYHQDIKQIEHKLAKSQYLLAHLEEERRILLPDSMCLNGQESVEERVALAEKLENSVPVEAEIVNLDSLE